MLGGHLDSWHGGTGAPDHAAGCAVAMEAVRIIQALGLKPRRTIRIALWTGESRPAWLESDVKEHFGEIVTPTPHRRRPDPHLRRNPRRRAGW